MRARDSLFEILLDGPSQTPSASHLGMITLGIAPSELVSSAVFLLGHKLIGCD
jgi:hypothetical protein